MTNSRIRPVIRLAAVLAALALPAVARQGDPVQAVRAQAPAIVIPKVSHPPKLSDYLEMKPGAGAPQMLELSGFVQYQPKDGAPAQEKTVVYIGYDERDLYVVFVCFDKEPGKIRARMTHREDIGSQDDEVQIYLDTFNDKRRAYGFMINPLGVQLDYIWTDSNGYDTSWDTVWDSSGRLTPQGYVAMMSIPFKSLRFLKQPDQRWGILLQRIVPHDNDNSFYPHVSVAVQSRLGQEGVASGLHDIAPGHGLQLNPYGVADAFRSLDQRDPNLPFFSQNHLGGTMGVDGKMIIHDSLVLDFTLNPDFRQLESDQPQNLVNQRFEVFFPEKRPFFQEGANFFSTPINLYFTRRIENPFAGLRLTGKLGNYGIGLLAVDDRGPGRSVPDDDPLRRKRAYFTVGRITREFGKQSSVGLFYSDRELSAVPAAESLCQNNALTTTQQISCVANSNRVGGGDFTLHFGDHLQTQGQAVISTTDEADGTHLAAHMLFWYGEYSTRHIEFNSLESDVSNGFVTLTGFFQRPDVIHESQYGRYLFRPEGKIVTDYGPQLFHREEWDHEGNRLAWQYEPDFRIEFKANTSIIFGHGFQREQLRPADFTQLTRDIDFPENYNWLNITSSYFKKLNFDAFLQIDKIPNFNPPGVSQPFLTDEVSSNMTASLRLWTPLTIDNSYILERLTTRTSPAQGIVNSHIIRSKFNYQYNPRLSFRTILQFNDQIANPLFTSLTTQKSFNADFLVSYLIHPGTALYLGYNSNLENFDPAAIALRQGLFRTGRSYINDGRVIFAKVSWLFRY